MSDNPDTYRVGYKKPPRHTQFKKGHSGNPSGKPKGIKTLSKLIRETLAQRVEIEGPGGPLRVTKLEAAVRTLVDKAVSGDPKILQLLITEFFRFEPFEAQPAAQEEQLGESDRKVMDLLYARLRLDARAQILAEMQQAAQPAVPDATANDSGDAGNAATGEAQAETSLS